MKIKLKRAIGSWARYKINVAHYNAAYHAWDEDKPIEPSATVLARDGYLSIQTDRRDEEFVMAIAKKLLGEPHAYDIIQMGCGIVQVWQKKETGK